MKARDVKVRPQKQIHQIHRGKSCTLAVNDKCRKDTRELDVSCIER